MDFPMNITISNIDHVSTVTFEKNDIARMDNRPWHGIAFSLGGEISYYHDQREIHLIPNHIVYIPQKSSYNILCHKSGSFALINFSTSSDPEIDQFVITDLINTEFSQHEFFKIKNIFEQNYTNGKYELMSSIYKIMSEAAASGKKKILPSNVRSAAEYIDSHISSPSLCNTDIANHTGISEVYLRKIFVKHMGISVNRYIQNKRMEKAKMLLTNSSLSITEISEMCGYGCIYYFCRAFRQKHNLSPSQYRNTNANNINLF